MENNYFIHVVETYEQYLARINSLIGEVTTDVSDTEVSTTTGSTVFARQELMGEIIVQKGASVGKSEDISRRAVEKHGADGFDALHKHRV